MAYNSMSLHPNHMIKSLSCRQEARLQIILLLLSMVLTYTCAIFKTTKTHKTLHQFCGSLYPFPIYPFLIYPFPIHPIPIPFSYTTSSQSFTVAQITVPMFGHFGKIGLG